MADRRNKPKCMSCNQLNRDNRSLKKQNKELRREVDQLRAIVDSGADYLTKMVRYIEGDS